MSQTFSGPLVRPATPPAAPDLGGVARRTTSGSTRRSTALGVVTLVACAATLLVPGSVTGTAVMNGSARGTALVMLLAALPLLALSTRAAAHGSARAGLARAGATAYLLYNAVMFLFATPFNRLFLLYVALLGLAVWSLVEQTQGIWRAAAVGPVRAPRWVAVYIWVVAGLNALAWLSRVVPATVGKDPSEVLDGTGLTTNPVFVQDLAFWLPAMAWLGLGVWRGHAPRIALAASGTIFWVLESLGVGVDQWWGHAADPASPVASAAAVPLFFVLAAASLVPTRRLLRDVDVAPATRRRGRAGPRSDLPLSVLAVVAAGNAVAALVGAWGLAFGVLDLGDTVDSRLPWGSTSVAALALCLVVAVPNAVLAVLAVRGDRRAGRAAAVTGVCLVGWILLELAVIVELSFFHPLYVAVGLLMLWLGLVADRSPGRRAPHTSD
jgi:hypothetical protein